MRVPTLSVCSVPCGTASDGSLGAGSTDGWLGVEAGAGCAAGLPLLTMTTTNPLSPSLYSLRGCVSCRILPL